MRTMGIQLKFNYIKTTHYLPLKNFNPQKLILLHSGINKEIQGTVGAIFPKIWVDSFEIIAGNEVS